MVILTLTDVNNMLMIIFVGLLFILVTSLIFSKMLDKADCDIMKVTIFFLYLMFVTLIIIGTLGMVISI